MTSPAAVAEKSCVVTLFPLFLKGVQPLQSRKKKNPTKPKCEVSETGTWLFKIHKQHLVQQGLDPMSSRFSATLNTMNQLHHSEENLDKNYSKDGL